MLRLSATGTATAETTAAAAARVAKTVVNCMAEDGEAQNERERKAGINGKAEK